MITDYETKMSRVITFKGSNAAPGSVYGNKPILSTYQSKDLNSLKQGSVQDSAEQVTRKIPFGLAGFNITGSMPGPLRGAEINEIDSIHDTAAYGTADFTK